MKSIVNILLIFQLSIFFKSVVCQVSEETCAQKANEMYIKCGAPSACLATCDDPKDQVMCDSVCEEGCYCVSGYIRDSSGVCVSKDRCVVANQCSGQNETYGTSCVPEGCTPTCEDRKATVLCGQVCSDGCYCNNGYLRDKAGDCVLEQDCPQSAIEPVECEGDHKERTDCAIQWQCQPTCEFPVNDQMCFAMCNPVGDCGCEQGYLMNANGDCIQEEICKAANPCGAHQTFKDCGPLDSCLPTCENPHNEDTICLAMCKQGCYCIEGYLKNANGECVSEESCRAMPSNSCDDELKEFTTCGGAPSCTPTCEDPEKNGICPFMCYEGCYCKSGYLMDKKGNCIESSKCYDSKNVSKSSDDDDDDDDEQ